MLPQGFKPFGSGGNTLLHPAVLAILIPAILLMWLLPRKYMPVPFLLLAILIPLEQQLRLVGLHFMVLRIVLLCAWIRVLVGLLRGRELLNNGLTRVDKLFILWVISGVVTYTLLWAEVGALINRLGFLYTAFGVYFLFRHLIRDREGVDRIIRTFAVICVVLGVLMTIEQLTGRNLLFIFGTRAEAEVREGHIRSQASFLHSILAGTCGAILVPAFVGLWRSARRSRVYATAGVISATLMTVTSASSTAVASYLAGLVGLCMWPLRRHMRAIRWALVAALVGLQMVMRAPVWALLNRIDLVGGSTGWHRFSLVDQFIYRFSEWWLIGTRNNAQWGLDMWDTANWYVSSGISGGLMVLVLFIAIIAYSFRSIGQALRASADDHATESFVWSLGAALFACAVSFIGITYFDQSIVVWYALLAIIVATTSPAKPAATEARKSTAPAARLTIGRDTVSPISLSHDCQKLSRLFSASVIVGRSSYNA